MIKGWKNKPEWVKYYEDRDENRRNAILDRFRQDIEYIEYVSTSSGFKPRLNIDLNAQRSAI